jgi:hypothetical protein
MTLRVASCIVRKLQNICGALQHLEDRPIGAGCYITLKCARGLYELHVCYKEQASLLRRMK